MKHMSFHGRRKIFTDVDQITKDNVVDVLQKALSVHTQNKTEIEYLYRYYKGDQPILQRVKEVRPEICNKVVENRANEIVSFEVGYLMGEPIQYVSRGDDETLTERINQLNAYMKSEDKASKDKELSEWSHICGTSFRMVLPDQATGVDPDEAPFEIYTLDPRFAFVVYHNSLGEKPVMNVKYVNRADGTTLYSVYTADHYFEITDLSVVSRDEPQVFGLPIIEYPANEARLGAFEVVLPLLDAINNVDSNRLDGVEQFIQALMLFHNVDISAEDFAQLKKDGAIKYKDIDQQLKAEIKYLVEELNQQQTQTLVDHLYETVLTIVGMPNRNGGSSTSDTGTAVVYRDGWSSAEARAKDSELVFKKSEKEFLKLILRICRDLSELELKLSNIEIRFTRRNYENITEKANVLTTMLNNPKIAPQLAFQHCGMFVDAESAYLASKAYAEEQEKKQLEQLTAIAGVKSGGEGDGKGGSKNGGKDDV